MVAEHRAVEEVVQGQSLVPVPAELGHGMVVGDQQGHDTLKVGLAIQYDTIHNTQYNQQGHNPLEVGLVTIY